MKKETTKIDLRKSDKTDIVVVHKALLDLSRVLHLYGYKIQIKKTKTLADRSEKSTV